MLAPKATGAATANKPTSTTKAAVTRTALNAAPPAAPPPPPVGLKKPAATCVTVGAAAAAAASKLKRSASSASNGAQSHAGGGGLKSAASRSSLQSDTTLSVCSLASSQATSATTATASSMAAGARRPAPGAGIKKSSSSLSGASSPMSRRPVAKPAAPGQISFSGIKRPVSSPTAARTTSAASAAAATSNPSQLAAALRDKDQQIKLLIKERDEKKFLAEKLARQAGEWREKFEASEVERSHMTSEADDEVVELRRLAQEFEDENKSLAKRFSEREQFISDLQFKFVEMQCERDELTRELEFKREQLVEVERERAEMVEGQKSGGEIVTERAISKAKYEREISELKEKITCRDEQMIQLRTSLEMRKNEVTNLQTHTADLERKLRIETERSERHLKRIDEVNLELKAADAKLTTKAEENEVQEKQIKQLRHDLRQAEEKLEQLSLARKKDVDILHNKLSAARRGGVSGGSTTPSGGRASPSQGAAAAAYKTPTPQDEIVRLQMEIRDLKDQLIDREAELDCNRRDLEVIKRKMETRTLEVDCNNQELARRCQDLLEQNRQSEDTIKQLLRSTTEHSASLMRATEDLKEANGKCVKLREEVSELEGKIEEQSKQINALSRENKQLHEENEARGEQADLLRQQVDALNEQIGELCAQLDVQTNNLHKDRETLADQLTEHEIQAAQLRQELASARQDLRSQKLVQQEICTERDCLKCDLELKEKYIKSRNEVLETMRLELDDCKRSLSEHKLKLDNLRSTSQLELEESGRELKNQLDQLKRELQLKMQECQTLGAQCCSLQAQLDELKARNELEVDEKFDEMRKKHSDELDELHLKINALEEELEETRTATLKRPASAAAAAAAATPENGSQSADKEVGEEKSLESNMSKYESEIEFLNSVVVDMQRKCDSYKSQLAQIEQERQLASTLNDHFDHHLTQVLNCKPASSSASSTSSAVSQQPTSNNNNNNLTNHNTQRQRASTLKRSQTSSQQQHTETRPKATASTLTRQRVVRIQDPLDELLLEAARSQQPIVTRPISGRPFCDICQVYDTHHTIYCSKVDEKLAARSLNEAATSATLNNNNNSGAHPNGYSGQQQQQTVDDMFREYVEALEGATGGRQQASYAPFTSLRRPSKQQQQQNGGSKLHCENCDLLGHSAQSCNIGIKIN